jgi:hypothetical protein
VAAWLKLVGKADWPVSEHWVMERSDLLKEIRFGERHPPTPIRRGDRLVYYAVGSQRLIAVVEVLSEKARHDATVEWERQWPIVLDIRPILKVGRVSQGPATSVLGVAEDLAHQSFVPLKSAQFDLAVEALRAAGAR